MAVYHYLIETIYDPLLAYAVSQIDDKNSSDVFRAFYDYATGVIDPLHTLLLARDVITERHAQDAVPAETFPEDRQDFPIMLPFADYKDVYFAEAAETGKYAGLLTKDRTGITVISAAALALAEEAAVHPVNKLTSKILSYQEPQLVLAGAMFVDKAYQAVYSLSKPNPQAKKS